MIDYIKMSNKIIIVIKKYLFAIYNDKHLLVSDFRDDDDENSVGI
jgi:hypothetical protein